MCMFQDFPWGPVVKILYFPGKGWRFYLSSGKSDSTCCAAQPKKKSKLKNKYMCVYVCFKIVLDLQKIWEDNIEHSYIPYSGFPY